MRLLLASDSYPPFIGGADLQVQMLAHAMRNAGHEVRVVTPWQPGLAATEDDSGVQVDRPRALLTRVPWFSRDPQRRHHPPLPDPGTIAAVRSIVRRFRPDLVHSYGWISYSVAAALLGTSTPLMLSARDFGYVCAIRTYLYYRGSVCSGPGLVKCLGCAAVTYSRDEAGDATAGRRGNRIRASHRLRGIAKALAAVGATFAGRPLLRSNLRGLHAVSTFVGSEMRRELLRAADGRMPIEFVIPSFLPSLEREDPDQAVLARLPAEPYILFVGALLPEKGVWVLLDAYRRLDQPAPPLVLLGPSSYKSPTSLPPGVVALGSTSHATVMAAWDRALFGVVPSVGAEAFGNVVTEAMRAGRAVIASRIGGIVDIVEEGVSGVLVDPGDPQALAVAMNRLVSDVPLRHSLAVGARRRAEAFAADAIVPRFEAAYQAVLDRVT